MKDYFKDKITLTEFRGSFEFVLIVVYIFGMMRLLRLVPSWVQYMPVWDLVGSLAYGLGFLFLESLAITGMLFMAFMLLPPKWVQGKFVLYSMFFILEWILTVTGIYFMSLYIFRFKLYVVFGVFYLLSIYFAQKSKDLVLSFNLLPARLRGLAWFYIGVGVLSWVIIILRNTVL